LVGLKIARVAPLICWWTDRHTDTHTQTCSSQYFATAAAGEVTSLLLLVLGHDYVYEIKFFLHARIK